MQNNCRDVTAFLTTRKAAFFDGSFVVEMKSVLLLSPYNYSGKYLKRSGRAILGPYFYHSFDPHARVIKLDVFIR